MKANISIITDFGNELGKVASTDTNGGGEGSSTAELVPRGIQALPLDYAPMKDYIAKGREVFSFEREGECVICNEHMPPSEGLYALCSNDGCEGVGHLSCWSRYILPEHEKESIIPVAGNCPKCHGPVKWGDMMTELTLRLRGAKEVDKLLKKKRKAKA